MKRSNCCDAPIIDGDICTICHDHCEPIESKSISLFDVFANSHKEAEKIKQLIRDDNNIRPAMRQLI